MVGLRDLIGSGAVIPAGTPEFKVTYDAWNKAASRLFRSHLDPDFLFSYKVDYLITRPVQLPAALPEMSFLMADKVEAPDLAGSWRACLFFADQRDLAVDRNKQRDPRCDSLGASFIQLVERDGSLAGARWSLDRVKGLARR